MTPERHDRIGELYHAALEVEPERRASFLDWACAGDEELRREVMSLVASHEEAGDFIAKPALEVAAGLLADYEAGSLAGETLGPYKVLSLLGAGGMGEVYLAEDVRLGRRVALKLLPRYFTRDAERLRRFRQEARAASALNHPNILTIHEVGRVADSHFIVTEFIDGETLRERLTGTGVKPAEAIDVATQAANALSAAHEAGIIHRDIKPENLMIRRDGYVKLLDFGLAKLGEKPGEQRPPEKGARPRASAETIPGLVMGTAHYMSPEQAQGLKVDERTDIWSLGVVLYEMLTGRVPFETGTPGYVAVSVSESEPPPLAEYAPEAPAELQRVVSKALRRNRDERYQTMRDLLADLRSLKRELESGAFEASGGVVRQPPVTGPGPGGAVTAANSLSLGRLFPGAGRRRKGALLALAALAVTLAGVARLVWSDKPAIGSLAILPFVNTTTDPDTEHLSDGITESLINNLSQLPGLRVMARSTVFSYKGREADPRKVGGELGVNAVVTGKVTQLGDTLIIQVDLLDVASGSQLWGGQFNRRMSDVLAVQAEISREISEGLRVKMTSEDRRRITKHHTNDVGAYQDYLRGRFHWNRRTGEGLRKSIEHFNHALAKDPTYALAYAGLADSYNMLARFSMLGPQEAYPLARSAARKALEIDETLAEAHTALAVVRMDYEWDLESAEAGFRRAISLNPGYPEAHQWYGLLLAARGRMDEAFGEMKRAQELDPLSLIIDLGAGGLYIYARRYPEAITHFQKTGELHPGAHQPPANLAYIYEIEGRHDEAVAAYLKSRTLAGASPEKVAALREAYASAGWRGYLHERLDEMREPPRQYVSPFTFALLHAQLGEKDQAFASLERAYEERNFRLLFLRIDPRLDALRSDPRFTDLVRRVGVSHQF